MHFSGPKFGKSHSTVIDHAVDMVKAAKKMPWVRKIVLGEIKQCGSGLIRYDFKDIQAGIEVMVRGPRTVQKIALITSNREETKVELKKKLGL